MMMLILYGEGDGCECMNVNIIVVASTVTTDIDVIGLDATCHLSCLISFTNILCTYDALYDT
jgi:hypothetical protein